MQVNPGEYSLYFKVLQSAVSFQHGAKLDITLFCRNHLEAVSDFFLLWFFPHLVSSLC